MASSELVFHVKKDIRRHFDSCYIDLVEVAI